jgi:hypothetical protein
MDLPVRRQAADEAIGVRGSEHRISGVFEDDLRVLSIVAGFGHFGFSLSLSAFLQGHSAFGRSRRAI